MHVCSIRLLIDAAPHRIRAEYIATRLRTLQNQVNSLDDCVTVHRSTTLFDLLLDAQNSHLFAYNIFIKTLYMFRALPCSSSGGLRRNCIYTASGIVTLCR